jgi:hypothetical protein
MRPLLLLGAAAGLALLGAAPARPSALGGVQPGLWEVSRSAAGHGARRLCLRDMLALAGVGHPGERCAPRVLSERAGLVVLELSCPAGDFARSRLSVLTPRSLKLESQGIHRGAPFAVTLHARRVGSCPAANSRR